MEGLKIANWLLIKPNKILLILGVVLVIYVSVLFNFEDIRTSLAEKRSCSHWMFPKSMKFEWKSLNEQLQLLWDQKVLAMIDV